jgi:hypothetical protein
MAVESRPGSLTGMPDDRLGTSAVSVVVSELQWTPDVTPAVMDRISRDAVAYPEQFDRRPLAQAPAVPPLPATRSAKRTISRLAVFAVVLVIIVALVAFAASVSATTDPGATLPSILNVATETS